MIKRIGGAVIGLLKRIGGAVIGLLIGCILFSLFAFFAIVVFPAVYSMLLGFGINEYTAEFVMFFGSIIILGCIICGFIFLGDD